MPNIFGQKKYYDNNKVLNDDELTDIHNHEHNISGCTRDNGPITYMEQSEHNNNN
jgi:hypothetical protein